MRTQGTDSCVLQFTAATCEFFADYGWYSGAISANDGDQNYRSEATKVDGRAATIATYTTSDPTRYAAAIHVPQVSPSSPGVKLTMVAQCRTQAGQSDALALFGTLRFD